MTDNDVLRDGAGLASGKTFGELCVNIVMSEDIP